MELTGEGRNLSALMPQGSLECGHPASRCLLIVGKWAAATAQPAGGSMGEEEEPGKNRCFPKPIRARTLLFTDPALKS